MIDASFVRCDIVAVRLGVPAAWLRAEADAGRVPSFRAGKSVMMHQGDVEAVLRERAKQAQEPTL